MDAGVNNEAAKNAPGAAGANRASAETVASFAPIPQSKAVAISQRFSPIGASRKQSRRPRAAGILSPGAQGRSVGEKCRASPNSNVTPKITPPALRRKPPVSRTARPKAAAGFTPRSGGSVGGRQNGCPFRRRYATVQTIKSMTKPSKWIPSAINHPQDPKKLPARSEYTGIRAEQEISGRTVQQRRRSRQSYMERQDITAGTVHPTPRRKETQARPSSPNRRIKGSVIFAARAR